MAEDRMPVIAVHEQARKAEDVQEIQARREALELIARKAGFAGVQDMTRWFWKRTVILAKDRIDTEPAIQQVFREVIDRACAAMLAAPKKPK